MALTKVKSFKYVNRDRLSESELYSCNYSNKSNLFCAIVYSIPVYSVIRTAVPYIHGIPTMYCTAGLSTNRVQPYDLTPVRLRRL